MSGPVDEKELEEILNQVSDSSSDEEEVDENDLIGFGPKKVAESKEEKSSKKRKRDDDDDEEDDEDDEDAVVNVDFQFFDPREVDHYTVKIMLRNYLDLKDFDAGELAKLVANQVSVGSMVKNDESGKEQPLGFISAINMHRYKDKKCIKQIKSYFLSHCGGEANQKKLKALFDDTSKPLGLVLQDRVINMPQQLVPPLHQALMDDIEWAVKDDQESEKVRKTFDFQNFLMLGKCFYAEDRDNQLKDPSDNAGKKKKKRAKTAGKQETEYFRFEEEYYEKASFLTHTFASRPVDSRTLTELDMMPQTRVLMAFKRSKLPAILKKVASFGML